MEHPPKARFTPEQLIESTVYTKKIWEALKAQHVQVRYKHDTWIGYSNKKQKLIQLGLAPLPPDVKQQTGLESLDALNERKYLLSHEIIHHVLWDVFDDQDAFAEVKNLLTTAKAIRQGTGVGLSRLGSLGFYHDSSHGGAFIEDVVELLNMYSIDPNLLAQYLEWLTKSDIETLRAKGLFKITNEQVRKYIYKNIEITIGDYLEKYQQT